jgi:ribonucleoside-diphosphate reductase alpha chain
VIAPYAVHAKINWTAIEETVKIATRFLDNVIDVSHYPLKAQREQARGTRRIGLGLTGLADMFVMLGMRYGSAESMALARDIMKRISEVTWRSSIELGQEKGVFPFYQPDYLRGEFVQTLDEQVRQDLSKQGVRNSHHNTIAPTGTTSLFANNVSNGIEPIFRAEYDRHMRMANNEMQTFHVKDYAYHYWRHEQKSNMPPAWVDTDTLSPEAHLEMQGAMQPYVDNAISKTINIPGNFPFEKLADVYTRAYALGLKGCTVFRPNPVTGAVLEGAFSAGLRDTSHR